LAPVARVAVLPLTVPLGGAGEPFMVEPSVLGAIVALLPVRPLGWGGGDVGVDGLRLEQLKGVVSRCFRSARKLHGADVGQREWITALQAGHVTAAVIICNRHSRIFIARLTTSIRKPPLSQ
jgi:hypothetical protein